MSVKFARTVLEKLGLAGIIGATILAVAASSLLSVRLAVFAFILAVFALAVKIDQRRQTK